MPSSLGFGVGWVYGLGLYILGLGFRVIHICINVFM